MYFVYRVEKAKKFVKAISRPTRSDLVPIRVKEPVRFEQVETIFPRFVFCTVFICLFILLSHTATEVLTVLYAVLVQFSNSPRLPSYIWKSNESEYI